MVNKFSYYGYNGVLTQDIEADTTSFTTSGLSALNPDNLPCYVRITDGNNASFGHLTNAETINIISMSGNTVTNCERGAGVSIGGGAAKAWAAGSYCVQLITPEAFNSFVQVEKTALRTASAGGTANAITATFSPEVTELSNGQSFLIQAQYANTVTNPTLSINGLPAKTIIKENNQPLELGDILGANFWMELIYDASLDKFQLLNPSMINFAEKNIFGIGQEYTGNIANERAVDVTYLNDTGKTIFVSINASTPVDAGGVDVYVSFFVNNKLSGFGHTKYGFTHTTISVPVPNGSTYKLTATGACSIQSWAELR